MKVITASNNPVKIQATLRGFQQMFPQEIFDVKGASIPSGVSDQPRSDEETYQGAYNRAMGAKKAFPEADYWVGIEGGIGDNQGRMEAFAWIVIISHLGIGQARSNAFTLPPAVAGLIHQGKELGEADDIVFGKSNSKQKNGAVGLLTGDVINRETLYSPTVIMALIPFKNKELYFK